MGRNETRARILGAAAKLFAERGYMGTTTSAIASKAGVNEVTLFRHFDSKVGIVQALGASLDSAPNEYPPKEAIVPGDLRSTLRNLAVIEIKSAVASGGLVLRLSFDARSVPELREAMGDVSGSNLGGLATWLEARQKRGEVRTDLPAASLAEAFFSLTSTLVMGRMAIGIPGPAAGDIRNMAERQTSLLWSGIEPQQIKEREGVST
jgi:AcrR family transcriptional regulator